MSARRSTKMLAPPSRDTAVGRAQPTPAAADRRSGLGEDSTAKTNPFRAVEACGRGSKSFSQSTPKTSAPPRTAARSIMLVDMKAIAIEEASRLSNVLTPSPRTSATTARTQGGQDPLTLMAGALRPPPGCGRATTLPYPTGGVRLACLCIVLARFMKPSAAFNHFACRFTAATRAVAISEDIPYAHVAEVMQGEIHGVALLAVAALQAVGATSSSRAAQVTAPAPMSERAG